jgi:phage terminase large subunit-like protein
MSIYSECLLRLAATTPSGADWGSMMVTFTPLLGLSEVAMHFLANTPLIDTTPADHDSGADQLRDLMG